jgi:hypothetical protein
MADNDNSQLSLGEIIINLPAVRAAKKVNTLSHVHRRLIERIETAQQNELAFQHSVLARCLCGLHRWLLLKLGDYNLESRNDLVRSRLSPSWLAGDLRPVPHEHHAVFDLG